MVRAEVRLEQKDPALAELRIEWPKLKSEVGI